MKTELLSISQIDIPDDVERPEARVDDDLLQKSIQQGGVQQPVVVLRGANGRHTLVDGLRRMRAVQALGGGKIPAVIDAPPAGADPEDYRRRLRFILDQHRQDLMPTQKAELIDTLKAMFGMNHRQIAAYIGIVPDSVTNWLAVKQYVEPVRQAIDAGALTMQAARVFDGMTESGQEKLWKEHAQELMTQSGSALHKQLRKRYSPEAHPEMYRDAQLVTQRLARVQGKRKPTARVNYSAEEKKRLLASYEMKEVELQDGKEELGQLKKEISAATPIVAAISRNRDLMALVPAEMREELERFAEIYV